jgi:hypothetical protein
MSSVQCLGSARNKKGKLSSTTDVYEKHRETAAHASSAMKSALASVGEGPEDGAGVLVYDVTKVHGNGEQEDQEKKIDAKE